MGNARILPTPRLVDDYDRLVDAYAAYKQIWAEDDHTFGYAALLRSLGKLDGKLVLDVGCGQGNFSEILSSQGAEVVGVDISEEMIQKAKSRSNSTGHYEVISRAQFPFPNAKFDTAVTTFCLCTEPNFESVEATIAETSRVLKPGALFGILNANYAGANGQVFRAHAIEKVEGLKHNDPIKVLLKMPDGKMLPVQDYYHDMEHYSAALKRQNFENIKIEDVAIPDGRMPFKLITAQKCA